MRQARAHARGILAVTPGQARSGSWSICKHDSRQRTPLPEHPGWRPTPIRGWDAEMPRTCRFQGLPWASHGGRSRCASWPQASGRWAAVKSAVNKSWHGPSPPRGTRPIVLPPKRGTPSVSENPRRMTSALAHKRERAAITSGNAHVALDAHVLVWKQRAVSANRGFRPAARSPHSATRDICASGDPGQDTGIRPRAAKLRCARQEPYGLACRAALDRHVRHSKPPCTPVQVHLARRNPFGLVAARHNIYAVHARGPRVPRDAREPANRNWPPRGGR